MGKMNGGKIRSVGTAGPEKGNLKNKYAKTAFGFQKDGECLEKNRTQEETKQEGGKGRGIAQSLLKGAAGKLRKKVNGGAEEIDGPSRTGYLPSP